jgi:internalin A
MAEEGLRPITRELLTIERAARNGRAKLDFSRLGSSEIPAEIGQLTKLRILDLSRNRLTSLPESIGQLTNLEILDLRHNQLTWLPLSLLQLGKLKTLMLEGNPFEPGLQSAYDAGLPELMAYLRSLEEAEPLYEAKLVLVGEGGVGKTTLLKALMGREEEPPRAGEPTTHGVQIDVHALRLPHPDQEGVEIQLNAWDFGGQEVYRVTHQFFSAAAPSTCWSGSPGAA